MRHKDKRPNRVRIVQILNDGYIGGAQRSVQWYASVADRVHFEHTFIFLYAGGPIYDSLAAMGYRVILLNWKNGRTLGGRLSLLKLLRELRPHLVHDHGATPASRLFMRLAVRCPIVSTQHGSFFEQGRLQRLCSRLDDKVTDLVIANSEFSALKHRKLYSRASSAIRTVYLGLDMATWDGGSARSNPDPSTQQNDRLKIMFVARLEEYKGVMHLPHLAGALRERGVRDFEIMIAGDGPAREKCEMLAEQLGVSQFLTFLGWQEDVRSLLSQGDILVFPSLWNEPFGLVLLEAVASGLMVAAYDGGGVREAIGDAPGTWIVTKGDVEALANAIVTARNKRSDHHRDAGLDYVRARFDIRRTARNLESIYAELTRRELPRIAA